LPIHPYIYILLVKEGKIAAVGKIATLEFNEGSFEQGFSVTLCLGDFAAPIHTKVTGKLPPNPALPLAYAQWRSHYLNLLSNPQFNSRPICLPKASNSSPDDCQQAAQAVSQELNQWLRSPSFLSIWQTWLTKINPTDDLDVLLQTDNPQLQKLPWHLWDLFLTYPKAELALSSANYDTSPPVNPVVMPAVNILAILGNSEGIDTTTDRATLSSIAGTTVKYLTEPQRKDLTDELWQQPWRILFFAGHSASTVKTGQISVNPEESLSIEDLKYALRHAVAGGLQLAIFNSCDGLGLAQALSELQIPNLIVMRESVPDVVAQTFLTYFLKAFSQGCSLHQSIRQAREQLQSLENHYPCATWLPILYQTPSSRPLTWQGLTDGAQGSKSSSKFQFPKLLKSIAMSAMVAASVIAVRELGWLQPLELKAFDLLMRSRPSEPTDSRLLIVGIDNTDIKLDETEKDTFKMQQRGRGTISNAALEIVLKKITLAKPRLIGLDIYRDFPVTDQPTIAKQLQTIPNLIAICRSSDTQNEQPGVKPPPGIDIDRIGFSDFVVDPDGVVRRHLLFMDPEPASPCVANYAFSVQLAATYLSNAGFEWIFTPDGDLKLGSQVFLKLNDRSGSYSGIDPGGNQILLNYRASSQAFDQVTLRQLLNGEVSASVMKDRIVLIGYTGKGVNDYSPTPYGNLPGVLIHAHMISQLLSAVETNRSVLWSLSEVAEMAWIGAWAVASGLLMCLGPPFKKVSQIWTRAGLTIGLLSSGVTLICYVVILQGGWIPWIPSVMAIVLTTVTSSIAALKAQPPPLQNPLPNQRPSSDS
jgi:CHASE2 domain-containing sensor protein